MRYELARVTSALADSAERRHAALQEAAQAAAQQAALTDELHLAQVGALLCPHGSRRRKPRPRNRALTAICHHGPCICSNACVATMGMLRLLLAYVRSADTVADHVYCLQSIGSPCG